MRFIKVLGLAAVAAMAAMVLFSVGSASAADEIVICKKLVKNGELCPTGEFFPKGTKILALAENPVLESTSGTVTCEDATAVATSLSSMGQTLPVSIALEFGVLPTPALGTGCKNANGVHSVIVEGATIEAEPKGAEDDWWLKASGSAQILEPFGIPFITCKYGAEGIKSLIDVDAGKHKLAHEKEEKALALILVSATLNKISGFGCPATSNWLASYTVYLVTPPNVGEPTLGWLALYKELTPEEKKMQAELGQ